MPWSVMARCSRIVSWLRSSHVTSPSVSLRASGASEAVSSNATRSPRQPLGSGRGRLASNIAGAPTPGTSVIPSRARDLLLSVESRRSLVALLLGMTDSG